MALISRKQLLKELLPGLNALFGVEYKLYHRKLLGGNDAVHGLAPLKLTIDGAEDAIHEKSSSV